MNKANTSPSRSNRLYPRLAFLLLSLGGIGLLFYLLSAPSSLPPLTFNTLSGQQISSQQLKGHVTLLNFWATSCPGCVKEMPRLVELHQRHAPQGLRVLAIAMAYDPPNYVKEFVQSRALPFDVVLDLDGRLAQTLGQVSMTPTSFLIDQQGHIVKTILGEADFAKLSQEIESLL